MRNLLTVACLAAFTAANSTTPMDLLFKAYRSCADGDTVSCLRKKTVQLIERVSKEESLSLIGDSLVIVRDPQVNVTFEFGNDRSLGDTVSKYLSTHRIQFKIPQPNFLQTEEQGRKKNKGYGGIGLMMGGMMMAMGMAALAALAGKALAASMAALMMAAMAALKKGGGGGGGHSSYEVISIPSHHHRSFLEQEGETEPYKYYDSSYENQN